MGNTLTGLIPTIYKALDVVSRELVGLIPSVTLLPGTDQVAKDQTITFPVSPASSASDITPGITPPDAGTQTIGASTLSISKARSVPVMWTGEEQTSVGSQYETILRDQFAQAFRTLTNEMEADLADLYKLASRAYGTAGTAPFGTAGDFSDAAQVRKILADNGAPLGDLQLVLDTAAGASLRGKQSQVYMTNNTGLLNQGVLFDIHGMKIRESAQIKAHTKGTGTGYAVNNVSGYAAGSTTIAVDTGSNTVIAGDVFTNSQSGRDDNKYIVKTALSAGSLVLNAPGIRVAWANDDTVAVGGSYRANLAFARSAIVLATRVPKMPLGGDMADDVMLVTDPVSGMTFQIALYRLYRQVKYEVGIAWGVKAVKSEHIAILLG